MNDFDIRFRLEEFKVLDKAICGLPLPLRVVIQGWLYWLETKFIEARAIAAVDKAIEDYNNLKLDPPVPQPIITETPSAIEGLPEMRITAPWYERSTTRKETEGGL